MKKLKKIRIGMAIVALGLLPLASTCSTTAFAESPKEVTSHVQETQVLVVEYCEGSLSAQQAILEELATKGMSVPISSESPLRSFELVVRDPVYNVLHQGFIYRKEYPVGASMSAKSFDTTDPIFLDNGRVGIPEGFRLEFDVERLADGNMDVLFHGEEHKKESIPGESTARMRTFHSAGRVKVYPNNCTAITNIDGKGGFLLLTYRYGRKF